MVRVVGVLPMGSTRPPAPMWSYINKMLIGRDILPVGELPEPLGSRRPYLYSEQLGSGEYSINMTQKTILDHLFCIKGWPWELALV